MKRMVMVVFALVLMSATQVFASTATGNLGLSILQQGDHMMAPWNLNFQKLDNRVTTEDARHTAHSTAESNLNALVNDVPEGYRLTGTFNTTTGVVFDLTDNGLADVDNVNEYVVFITPLATAADIGTVSADKTTTGFTVKCSGSNTTTGFEAAVYYITSHNTYGNSARRVWYVSPDASITDHADDGVAGAIGNGSLADIVEYLTSITTYAQVILPSNKTYQLKQNLTAGDYVEIIPMPGAIIDNDYSIRTADYMWCLSGSGTGEYFLVGAGSVCGSSYVATGLVEPTKLLENNVALTAGSVGSLAVSEWDWSNNDAIGFTTVYVRLSDSTDPDGKALDYVTAGVTFTANQFNAGAYQTFSGEGTWSIVPTTGEALTEWWGVYDASTNCQPAFQKAIYAGKNIRLRAGKTYFLNSQVAAGYAYSGRNINATGATLIGSTGLAASAMIHFGDPHDADASDERTTDLSWIGGTIQLNGAKKFMEIRNTSDVSVKDVFVQEVSGSLIAGSAGIHIINSFNVYVEHFNIHGDKADPASGTACLTNGILVESDTNDGDPIMNNIAIEHGLVQRCVTNIGLDFNTSASSGMIIDDVALLSNTTPQSTYGVYIQGNVDNVSLRNIKEEQCQTGLYVDNSAVGRYAINIESAKFKMDDTQKGMSFFGTSGYVEIGTVESVVASGTAKLFDNVDCKVAVSGWPYATGEGTTTIWDGVGNAARRFKIMQSNNENRDQASFTVYPYMDGFTFDNAGSSVSVTGNLPAMSAVWDGFEVGFVNAEPGKSFTVEPSGTDRIQRLTAVAGDYLISATPGAVLRLRANTGSGLWIPTYTVGPWRDQSFYYSDASTTAISATGNIKTFSIPANDLGTKGKLRIKASGKKTGSASSKEIKLVWGGTESYIFHPANGDAADWMVDATIANRLSNAQTITWTGINTGISPVALYGDVNTAAKDTTADVTLALYGTLSPDSSGDTIVLYDWKVWIE